MKALVTRARALFGAGKRPAWVAPLLALVVVFCAIAARVPDTFLLPQNLLVMARQTVVVATCALGMTLVIVTGGIDLSTGSLVALTTVVIAKLLKGGTSPALAVLCALAVSGLVGATIGAFIGRLRLKPFVVTLGAMSVLRGAAKGLADEQKIDCDPRGLEKTLAADLSAPGIWIALTLAVLVACVLTYTRFGRHVYAVGSNEAAARLVGIDTGRVKIAVYALSSLLVGVAGVMEFSTLTVGDPTDSVGLELDVIAAVVIGGGSLSGGEGSIAGSLLGALLMTVIRSGAVHLGMQSWVQEVVTGIIIVLAVALDRARHRRTARG
ncbi:Ribose ABC transport system, permease protein RbsC [Labilithrix luteola]|uniref:Ribose ABC transport system, permease protein RbsC n=1 Tax=Labilithrix luteola TaxID=1391654 RepID=A0A0K1Q976_9BACT|nr:ABC transporter permease [Labilithrix luteola]AKV01980.1 Ribose ABC transport system, permease protein RbsC [Labilithrix luteola]